jgi:hypothetical protein
MEVRAGLAWPGMAFYYSLLSFTHTYSALVLHITNNSNIHDSATTCREILIFFSSYRVCSGRLCAPSRVSSTTWSLYLCIVEGNDQGAQFVEVFILLCLSLPRCATGYILQQRLSFDSTPSKHNSDNPLIRYAYPDEKTRTP